MQIETSWTPKILHWFTVDLKDKRGNNWRAYFFVWMLRQKAFRALSPCRVTSKLAHTSAMDLHKFKTWHSVGKFFPLVDCGELHRFCAHFSALQHLPKHIYYRIDMHYRAAGSTAGKHCSPVAFFLKMKTLLGYRCCCLGNLVTLTLLSTLFTTRFIKCVAAGN